METNNTPAYFTRFEHLNMSRSANGVLTVHFTTNNGPIVFTGTDHREFVEAFSQIAQDRDNKVVILTGTGNEFFAQIDGPSLGDITNPRDWDKTWWEGQQSLQNLTSIGVPVISAINGPAIVHSEFALTADIILASEKAYFQDYPHLTFGIVPGDGMQTVWARALGEYRNKYFHYTQQKITAAEAKTLGVIAEVLPDNEALLNRANELAEQLLNIPELTRRHMRAMFIAPLRKALLEQVGYGLAVEGITATDLRIAAEEKAKQQNNA
ncbi:enoyl-CoA hydratase/isomerase family protein [Mucilaginibacter daejeonensis]|uniref:enoyl-CoA hydratase/isomerase family protein n=1 Tax=Mucilaginibacter daejeonensis TaxID=398049 RepID=UPI001D17930D|nr:enoyl-CoA hydratase/isomerase family protein [Mucilaginibacter daejeonensis]UEG54859.1 enoyl-CoA hydratase/isomerase family protein [Mucilaginibacter daejeonensis]